MILNYNKYRDSTNNYPYYLLNKKLKIDGKILMYVDILRIRKGGMKCP